MLDDGPRPMDLAPRPMGLAIRDVVVLLRRGELEVVDLADEALGWRRGPSRRRLARGFGARLAAGERRGEVAEGGPSGPRVGAGAGGFTSGGVLGGDEVGVVDFDEDRFLFQVGDVGLRHARGARGFSEDPRRGDPVEFVAEAVVPFRYEEHGLGVEVDEVHHGESSEGRRQRDPQELLLETADRPFPEDLAEGGAPAAAGLVCIVRVVVVVVVCGRLEGPPRDDEPSAPRVEVSAAFEFQLAFLRDDGLCQNDLGATLGLVHEQVREVVRGNLA
mmetsp:Transcript_36934/g.118394  ORF Transcript_36934/g.118394 Transcript_36934/m.118394 type:complete len:275 (-) Transcript_36934:1009-1833(-)